MIAVLVCTHSTLAQGLKEAVEMIAGKQEDFDVLCFMNGDDPEELKEKLSASVQRYADQGKECCVLVDLFAATPFNTALALSMETGTAIATGVNLPLLLEVLIGRSLSEEESVHAFLEKAMERVKDSMKVVDAKALIGE